MPLDIFPGDQREADAVAATRPGWGPGLEATFGEGFGAAWKSVAGSWRTLRVQANEAHQAIDWAAAFEKEAGYAPAQFDFRQPTAAQYDQLRKAYDNEKLKRPDLKIGEPPTAESAHAAAIEAERKLLGTDAAVRTRPQTLASSAGSLLGGIAGVAVDPINLAAVAAGASSGGVLAVALREAAVGGVSQAAISVSGLKLAREVDPNYGLADVGAEVGSAALGSAVLGGGIRALAKAWVRVSGRGRQIPPPAETSPVPLPESATAVVQPDLFPREGNFTAEEVVRFNKNAAEGRPAETQREVDYWNEMAAGAEDQGIGGSSPEDFARQLSGEFPRDVVDAGNVVTREAAVADSNPYRGAGPEGEVIHSRNYKEAEAAIAEGRPIDITDDAVTSGKWRPGRVFDSTGREVGVRYEVVEADSLIASHGDDLGVNPAYPAQLQPRERTRAVSQEQIAGIAAKLEPERLGPSTDAATGAPIVGPDNVVESGNGRVLAIKRAYGNGLTPNWSAADNSYLFKHVSLGKVGGEAKPFDPAAGPGLPAARELTAENGIRYYERRGTITAVDKDGDVIGVLKPAQHNGELVVDHIVVSPFVQRQGIGTRLLQLGKQHIPGLRTDLTTGLQSEAGAGILNKFNRAGNRGEAYRNFLKQQGFDTDGMTAPVLVARRTTPLNDSERAAFTDAANRATTLRMSAPEQALADARLIDGPTLDKLAAGGVESADNRPFVRGFFSKLPQSERGGLIDRQGVLSAEGQRRIEAALLARAYGDPALLARILEDADSNVKALGGALTDVAGRWAAMRDAVARGDIPAGMDITRDLLDAFRLVARARDEGSKLAMLVDQAEMFAAPSPLTKALLRLMYRNEDLTQAASRPAVARGLSGYVEEALKNTTDDRLFGEPLATGDVLSAALTKAGREDLIPAAIEATTPTLATERLADPEVDDAAIHQLEHLQEETPGLTIPVRSVDDLGNETVTMRPVSELINEADTEIKAAKEIGDCAIGQMTPAAA